MKLTIALEVADEHVMTEIQPRMAKVVDAFQVYLRELRKSDLEGSAGIYRLKEELRRRVNVAIYPGAGRKHPVQGNPGAVMAGPANRTSSPKTGASTWRRRAPADWARCSSRRSKLPGPARRRPRPQPGRDRQPARLRSQHGRQSSSRASRRSSTRRSSPTSACRCSRSSSTAWCGCRRPRCAISPPTTSKSRWSRSPRCASATTSTRSRCPRSSP